jgi:3-hydroxyisobutyrate dehydrogenase-like beta-hydroxyacid dehydrogenase
VLGWNRTAAKAKPLVEAGMRLAASARAVAEQCDVLLSSVTDTAALRAIAFGPAGIVPALRPDAVWVEMSTVSPVTTREVGAEAAKRGASLLDAPVSGSPVTIAQGQLAIYVGGDAAALERVRPYLLAIGPTITHVGPLGTAATAKIAINLAGPIQMIAFAESVLLAEKAGIDRRAAVEAVLRSVMASPMLKYRGPLVLDKPPAPLFSVSMMQKDVQLALELGRQLAVSLPATALANEMLSAARALGLEGDDFATVFDVLATMSGLPASPRSTGGQ